MEPSKICVLYDLFQYQDQIHYEKIYTQITKTCYASPAAIESPITNIDGVLQERLI